MICLQASDPCENAKKPLKYSTYFNYLLYLCKRDVNDMGVTFNDTEKKFVFDFEHDGAEDIDV